MISRRVSRDHQSISIDLRRAQPSVTAPGMVLSMVSSSLSKDNASSIRSSLIIIWRDVWVRLLLKCTLASLCVCFLTRDGACPCICNRFDEVSEPHDEASDAFSILRSIRQGLVPTRPVRPGVV